MRCERHENFGMLSFALWLQPLTGLVCWLSTRKFEVPAVGLVTENS